MGGGGGGGGEPVHIVILFAMTATLCKVSYGTFCRVVGGACHTIDGLAMLHFCHG